MLGKYAQTSGGRPPSEKFLKTETKVTRNRNVCKISSHGEIIIFSVHGASLGGIAGCDGVQYETRQFRKISASGVDSLFDFGFNKY